MYPFCLFLSRCIYPSKFISFFLPSSHYSSDGESSPELPVLSKTRYHPPPGAQGRGKPSNPPPPSSPLYNGYNSAEEYDLRAEPFLVPEVRVYVCVFKETEHGIGKHPHSAFIQKVFLLFKSNLICSILRVHFSSNGLDIVAGLLSRKPRRRNAVCIYCCVLFSDVVCDFDSHSL